MAQSQKLRPGAAFLAACLIVVWVGGSFLTALFKLANRLWFGTWPDTRLYGLVPEAWTPGAADWAWAAPLGRLWSAALGCDVILWLLIAPPLLLLPCLILLRAEHGGMLPALRSSAKPFAAQRPVSVRLAPAPRRPGCFVCSTKKR